MSFHHLTFTERLTIEKMYNSGSSYREIAAFLNRAVSGIYREIQKGIYFKRDSKTWKDIKSYSATIAQQKADFQNTSHGRPVKLGNNYKYAEYVRQQIKDKFSPDAICGSLKHKGEFTVSTSTLYRYIDQGYIPGVSNNDLLEKPNRKRTYRKVHPAKRPPVGTSIEKRPDEIKHRNTFGHWEMDCVIGHSKGKGQAVLVLTERLTRYELIFKLKEKTALSVNRKMEKLIKNSPGLFQSITCDNGSEFSSAYTLPVPVYYCHPYCSSERGSNENGNRIIRRYFPKGSDFKKLTQKDCDYVASRINSMPRKLLNYATAAELFSEQVSSLIFS